MYEECSPATCEGSLQGLSVLFEAIFLASYTIYHD